MRTRNPEQWTEIELYQDGRFFRRFWFNVDSLVGFDSHFERYSGDVHCIVTYPSGDGAYSHQYDSPKGRIEVISGHSYPDWNYKVRVEGAWWQLESDTRATSPYAAAVANWDGSEWQVEYLL